MAKESSEGEFIKKKSADHNRRRIENLSRAYAVKENVIHSDQLEFLSIFPYSELLIWMLPAPNVTDHSYYIYIYSQLFLFLQTEDFCLLPMYCRPQCIEDFFFFDVVTKILRSATHGGSTKNWVLHGFSRHVVRPWNAF